MNLLRRLIPPFLLRADLWLQQNKPRLWATRIHYHLWFLLLVNVLVCGLGLLLPVNPRKFPDPENLFAYMILPAVVYFAFWVYKVVLFTVERRFGIRRGYAEVGEFLVHFLSIVLILSIPYNLCLTVALRIGHLVSDREFVGQVDTLNTQSPWFYGNNQYEEYDYGDMAMDVTMRTDMEVQELAENPAQPKWRHMAQGADTHEFFRSLEEYVHRNDLRPEGVDTRRALNDVYQQYVSACNQAADPDDTANYDPDTAAYYLHVADSIETHAPLLFVKFGLFTPYYSDLPFMSDSLREVRYIADQRAHTPPDKEAIARAVAIARTYSSAVRDLPVDSVLRQFQQRRTSTVGLGSADRQMSKVARAKALHYDPLEVPALLYGVVLSCFVLTILLSIFKNIYWQPFLIMIATAILLPIVILLFALITERSVFRTDDGKIMMWCYYWVGTFLIGMLFHVPGLRAYRTRSAVMTILGNLALPFFALFTFFLLDQEFDAFGQQALQARISDLSQTDPQLPLLYAQADALRERIQLVLQVVLWGGVLGYILVLHPLMRNLYTRLMALPERK